MQETNDQLTALIDVVRHIGFDVTHAHENLVFISDNLFILKFSDPIHHIDVYYNEDIEEERAVELMSRMDAAATDRGFQVTYKGAYCLTDSEDGTVSVEFFDLANW